jgi:hypothetical protein
MKTYFFILFVFAQLCLSSYLQNDPSTSLIRNDNPLNLEFENYIGKGVSQQMLTDFINYANSASAFYKNDT